MAALTRAELVHLFTGDDLSAPCYSRTLLRAIIEAYQPQSELTLVRTVFGWGSSGADKDARSLLGLEYKRWRASQSSSTMQ